MKKYISLLLITITFVLGTKDLVAQIPTIGSQPLEIKVFSTENSNEFDNPIVIGLEKSDKQNFKTFITEKDPKTNFLFGIEIQNQGYIVFSTSKEDVMNVFKYTFDKEKNLTSKKISNSFEFAKFSDAVQFSIASSN